MDHPNAFIGKTTQPTHEELATTLGPTAHLWTQLLESLTEDLSNPDREWYSLRPKYGWSLLLKIKKRRIVYMGPCEGCFRVSLVLGDKAMAAARATTLPKSVLKLLDDAPHYAEGTGLHFLVKNPKDLPAIRKLAKIKLAN